MSAFRVRHPLWALTLPVLVWAAHFLAVYALAALVCVSAVTDRQTVVATATVAATVAALLIIALAGALARRGRGASANAREDDAAMPAFVASGARVASVLAAIGVVWVAAPAIVLPPCVP